MYVESQWATVCSAVDVNAHHASAALQAIRLPNVRGHTEYRQSQHDATTIGLPGLQH